MSEYEEFLKRKIVTAISAGFEKPREKMNANLFDWQKDIVYWALKKGRAALFEDCGLGKGQPYGSKVLCENGWKNIEDLTICDKIYSSDGKIHDVIGVYPKSEIDTYRFFYSDGTSLVFDKDHLHIVRTNNDRQRGKPWRVMSTTDLLECGNIRYGDNGKSKNYDIPIVKPIEYQEKSYYISPYILGVLIGDGGLRSRINISSKDNDIIRRVADELPDGYKIKKRSGVDWNVTGTKGVKSKIRCELERLDLMGKYSYEKHIPNEYLRGSVSQRFELLRGLMDTDGYATEYTSSYTTTSEKLRDDFVELVRSLGGVPTVGEKIPKNTITGVLGRKAYTITFSLNTGNPFYLERKAKLYNPNPRGNGRWIERIEYEKKQKTVCIAVDSPDHSYITEHYVVTHNTIQQLEWAQSVSDYTNMPVLIVAPLAVAEQTKREGEKFGYVVTVCREQSHTKNGINICNYEMLEHFNADAFSGVVLDESSILKNYSGKMRTEIIEMFLKTPYKLSCTATPAPNDFMELGNQAEFLGVMSRTEMLATYFIHDGGDTSKWRLKGHAQDRFWEWVATWAVVLTKPSDLGYDGSGYILPELRTIQHTVHYDENIIDDNYSLFADIAQTLNERRNARRNSLVDRCKIAADLVNADKENQWLIWCDLNSEADELKSLIPNGVEVRGTDTPESKAERLNGFTNGDIKVMISKPSIAGFGLNWQNCHNMIFVGLSDSYEMMYQAIRRCYRFGQIKPVTVHIVTSEAEGAVKDNIDRKEKQSALMIAEMVKHTKEILQEEIRGTKRITIPYNPTVEMIVPEWLVSEK